MFYDNISILICKVLFSSSEVPDKQEIFLANHTFLHMFYFIGEYKKHSLNQIATDDQHPYTLTHRFPLRLQLTCLTLFQFQRLYSHQLKLIWFVFAETFLLD